MRNMNLWKCAAAVFRWCSVLAICVAQAGMAAGAAEDESASIVTAGGRLGLTQTEKMPVVALRGYGRVSGTLWQAPAGISPVSILQINCENEAKAQVLHAKFLSDLGLLPGVKPLRMETRRGALVAQSVEGQGAVAGLRCGAVVVVLAASREADLKVLYEDSLSAAATVNAAEPQVAVPMYLDRWDRHGFRFYYYPWTRPHGPDGREASKYDPMPEFDFLKQTQSGLVLWEKPLGADNAEGVLDYTWWDWALRQCQAMKLPVGINLETSHWLWLFNRYREQTILGMPQYVGGWYGLRNFDEGLLSWNAREAREQGLAQLQKAMRVDLANDNIINWLEPHGEMYHGACDVFVDYGPQADMGFRHFLQGKYVQVGEVAKRWFGDAGAIKSWDEVHVPEVASFLGWGPAAIDLTGQWRINFNAPYGEASAGVDLDDSSWPTIPAPGHDIVSLLPKSPAVYRRRFNVDAAWKSAHARVWLYVWDLNDTRPRKNETRTGVLVYLNGKLAEEKPRRESEGHWAALEAGSLLKAGENTIAISLPQGYFGYRIYLSAKPPVQYPGLGPQLNARWADFSDWLAWSRTRTVRRGAEAIRQVDPDRPITFMHPDEYSAGIKRICQDYGGIFHNTGYMAGVWADMNALQMNGVDLPTDVEPGSGAVDLPDFRRFMGRWSTEGVQGIDYFIHVGDIFWKPEIKKYFEQSQNLWHLIGKYHTPKAQLALLLSDRALRLGSFPWGYDANKNLHSGYWAWDLPRLLLPECHRDALDEGDFETGNASRYRVILDTNTSVMDEGLLTKIEQWVRAGGIFITYAQTGRHTSTQLDAWPISRLTGYAVTHIDEHDENGQIRRNRKIALAPGQTVFRGEDWNAVGHANGLTLRKTAADCRDLMLWQDGGVAIGLRQLGKGWIIHTGVKFAHDRGSGNRPAVQRFLGDVLAWANVPRIRASADGVLMRHFISNNGLYDVWSMWNERDKPVTTALVFREGLVPPRAIDVNTGQPLAMQTADGAVKISPLAFEPWETRVVLTPRQELASAPLRWFQLQRNWWRGTMAPAEPIKPLEQRLAIDLTEGWALKTLDEQADAAPLADPKLDDSAWPRRAVGILTDPPDVRHVVFRRRFTVPAAWNKGRVGLGVRTSEGTTFVNTGRLFLDGKPVTNWLGDGMVAAEFDGTLKPGTEHVLMIEVKGRTRLIGVRGSAWLAYKPDPPSRQDLAGEWILSSDGLRYGGTDPPAGSGRLEDRPAAGSHRRRAGDNVVLHALAEDSSIGGVIVNGHRVVRFRGRTSTEVDLNITPFVRFGQDNELILFASPGKRSIRALSLDVYDRAVPLIRLGGTSGLRRARTAAGAARSTVASRPLWTPATPRAML